VELLVVITIIGILAALITAAGVGALKKARQARIKVELDQMAMAIQSTGAFPPNCQVDDTNFTSGGDTTAIPIDESQVLIDVQRYVRQLATKYAEPNVLVAALVGDTTTASGANGALTGGMSAGEALVFWLSSVSSDPKLPFSGEGGPSYPIPSLGAADNYQLDPIESRNWVFPFDVSRLQPRLPDGYFDQSKGRFIEYMVNGQPRRINFWQYVPPKSTQPYLYFDASRHPAAPAFDPPAATDLSSTPLDVHAIKRRSESTAAEVAVEFCNRDKFQILHAGVDDIWGTFEPMSLAHSSLNEMTFYPDGPFTGDVADTLTNFSEGTLEDAQP
jgi:type II secretory pathway pseudopilin PulG